VSNKTLKNRFRVVSQREKAVYVSSSLFTLLVVHKRLGQVVRVERSLVEKAHIERLLVEIERVLFDSIELFVL
jgi:hypothetical protein